MHKFQPNSPTSFWAFTDYPNVQNISTIRSHVLGPINSPFPAFIHIKHAFYCTISTQAVHKFWAVTATQINPKKILTIRSQVLGPIKRPLTVSNQPKHRKTLKNGNKTQVGRKSYLKEFEETPDPGVHA